MLEKVFRPYVFFNTFSFMHINSPGSFHPTSDVMSDLQPNFILDLSCMGQIWLCTHAERNALSSKLLYQSDTFYFFIH